MQKPEMPYDVFFYEAFAEEAAQLQACLPEGIRAGFDVGAIAETGHASPPAGIISIRTQSRIPLAWASGVAAILTRSTGYDHVTDYLVACGRAVPSGYLPLYCRRAVAEQALLLWMALWRRLPVQMAQFGDFQRDGLTGRECEGRTLLSVGVGNIGHEVLRIGRALGMRSLGVDPVRRHADVDYVSIDAGLAQADVVVCAMSLNAQNQAYFHRDRWQGVKPGALFVNIARGEMAPLGDLAWALDQGLLGGVALDVYPNEAELGPAMRAGNRDASTEWTVLDALCRRANVICTPHNAFNTHESVENKSRQSIEQIVHFRQTGAFKWPVPVTRIS